MIFEHKDLRGKLKVGDKVRAVDGKNHTCDELDDNNIGNITQVTDSEFRINNCGHSYSPGYWLDVVDFVPTMENVCPGCFVKDVPGDVHCVVDVSVSGKVLFITRDSQDEEEFDGNIDESEGVYAYTRTELMRDGWKVFAPEEKASEMTVEEISKALGKTVKIVKSK